MLNIVQELFKRLALRRSVSGKRRANFSRLHLRQHRKRFNARVVVGNPVDDRVRHGAEIRPPSCGKIFLQTIP